jgi:oligopeptide/dipeptide ABC transporter ATP-binding protein
MPSPPILAVRGLKKHFSVSRRQGLLRIHDVVRAVDGIDLDIGPASTVGLVGESGCGKSTAGRAILRLIEPTAGSVVFDGTDLATLPPRDLRRLRRRMGIVFQDPMSSLNPRMSVGAIVGEPLGAHRLVSSRREMDERVGSLLESVGLRPEHAARYPHEFSGGQRQRIGIARAIATEPSLVILDEPISALDLSIRAQVLNLMADLQDRLGLAYLFIAHDLSVVRHACARVAVMYLGVIVEEGPTEDLFREPRHPYTEALLASAPVADPSRRIRRAPLEGDVPAASGEHAGCRFRTRCPIAEDRCAREGPALIESGGRKVACHLRSGAE